LRRGKKRPWKAGYEEDTKDEYSKEVERSSQ
jgi:hypothetical protein